MKNVVVVASLCLSAPALGANILNNPGFEAGSGADAADWAEIVGGASGAVERSSSMPNSGAFSALMSVDHIADPPSAGAYFIEQVGAVGSIDNSVNYDLSFDAKLADVNAGGFDVFVQILWLDQDASDGGGVKGEMLTGLFGLGINTSYQNFSFNDMDVPDGADSYLLRFQLSAGPVPGVVNGLYVDNASLAPAPGGVVLAMVGLGAGAVRRRR